ncbi:MAG: hypothetical protein EBR79_02155 [Proteobacteria bacterium]|nr:hypothetical protein [Pseudomonadota bacterium]NBX85635.1 hypothetical protein [Pseudomonadota bacterium]
MPNLHLFDLDDTLARTEVHIVPVWVEHMHNLMRKHGFAGTFQEFGARSAEFLNSHGHSMYGWGEFLGKSPEWMMGAIEEISQHIHQPVIDAVVPCPELVRLLQYLKDAGHTVAIATHGHAVYAVPVLTHLGILGSVVPPELLFDLGRTNGQLKRDVETFRWIEGEIARYTGHATFDRKVLYEDSLPNLIAGQQAGYVRVFIKPRAEMEAKNIQVSREDCDAWFPDVQWALREMHQFI